MLMFAILLAVFFDVMGTSVGLASEAGTIDEDGKIENIDRVLLIDAAGSVLGGGSSSSAHQIFVESATGIGEGARTGFANIVTGALFLLAVFISPLVSIVPFEAVAPALVVVGFLMVRQAVHIDWTDWGLGIPAFLTIIMMPFTYSIADGIGRQASSPSPSSAWYRAAARKYTRLCTSSQPPSWSSSAWA